MVFKKLKQIINKENLNVTLGILIGLVGYVVTVGYLVLNSDDNNRQRERLEQEYLVDTTHILKEYRLKLQDYWQNSETNHFSSDGNLNKKLRERRQKLEQDLRKYEQVKFYSGLKG